MYYESWKIEKNEWNVKNELKCIVLKGFIAVLNTKTIKKNEEFLLFRLSKKSTFFLDDRMKRMLLIFHWQ